jgi:hypothetical protein
MDAASREDIVAELAGAFEEAVDVTPDSDQPLHVMLPRVPLSPPWPSPARAIVRFVNWPDARPDFWIEQLVLGSSWRQFSFAFPWPPPLATATRAVLSWLNRFRETP